MSALAVFADRGDVGASGSLAELHAYRGEWDEVLRRASALLANPDGFSGNVHQDMVGLVWRAADETKRYADALASVRAMPKAARRFVLVKTVETYLAKNGKPPVPVIGEPLESPAQLRASTKKRIAAANNDPFVIFMAASGNPEFDDLVVVNYPKADPADILWDYAVDAARSFARKGRHDEAWKTIEAKLDAWGAVEGCQVAPVEPIYDQWLRDVMTPARCAKVLTTTRWG